jgi:hypothetical protein
MAVAWPWDDRGRSAVTADSVLQDLRALADMVQARYSRSINDVVKVALP